MKDAEKVSLKILVEIASELCWLVLNEEDEMGMLRRGEDMLQEDGLRLAEIKIGAFHILFVGLRNILLEDGLDGARSMRLSSLVVAPVDRANGSGVLLVELIAIDLYHF